MHYLHYQQYWQLLNYRLLLGLFLLFNYSAQAQDNVVYATGTVKTKDNTAIGACSVTLGQIPYPATTDAQNGQFSISGPALSTSNPAASESQVILQGTDVILKNIHGSLKLELSLYSFSGVRVKPLLTQIIDKGDFSFNLYSLLKSKSSQILIVKGQMGNKSFFINVPPEGTAPPQIIATTSLSKPQTTLKRKSAEDTLSIECKGYLVKKVPINVYGGEHNITLLKPNVLFISVDDLRPESATYNLGKAITPTTDKLAREGIQFNRAYCQNAVCGASRASLLTGIRSTATLFNAFDSRVDASTRSDAVTLPQAFKEQGYYTLSFGKIFHNWNDSEAKSWSEPVPTKPMSFLTYLDPESANYVNESNNRGPWFEAPDVHDTSYLDGKIANACIGNLDKMVAKNDPFFLACGFAKPHLPFYAPKKYWDMYDPDTLKLADNRFTPENAPTDLKSSTEVDGYHPRGIAKNSEEWHRKGVHAYKACVSYSDSQMGRLIKRLEEHNLRDNTIIVLWGDHGYNVGEHNFWGKHNVTHLSLRVPLIISIPGYQQNVTSPSFVELVDLYPTLGELAGIPYPQSQMEGVSMVPLLKDPSRPWKKAIFSRFQTASTIVTDKYAFTRYGDSTDKSKWMLFDHQVDPDENKNVVNDPAYATITAEMNQRWLDGWQAALPD